MKLNYNFAIQLKKKNSKTKIYYKAPKHETQ
ncbi:MAG: hypothetical protein RLZZ529_1895 [Bacteroidota bacterium]|jgi:hypothetical protein